MPLMKYFCFVGSILVALLCAANWLFPETAKQSVNSGIEDYGIRIHSTDKLPDPVVFDTSLPTIVPPPSTVTVAVQMPQEAFAQIVPTQLSVPASGHQPEKKRKIAKHNASKAATTYRPAPPTKLASAAQVEPPPVARMSLIEVIKERLGQGLFKLN